MNSSRGHVVVLGGIGGDSHSVGLNVLRQALTAHGYRVLYLGTQNALEEFFRLAAVSDAVLISTMDGHARYYLREFPELMRRYQPRGTRWYLGGNLTIGDGLGYERLFLEMGFDRAFVKFVDVATVLEHLARDLEGRQPTSRRPELWQGHQPTWPARWEAGEEPLPVAELEAERREVLECWATGRGAAALEANAEFLARQPSLPAAQARVLAGAPPLIQPRSGVALVEDQIRLFSAFQAAGATVLSYQVDSLTRNNNHRGVEEALREARAGGGSGLNGFPVVNHGVEGLRRVIAHLGVPLQVRHSTRDPRLLAEISYAGGVTAFEGGPICYNIPYYKDYPLAESIRRWRYVDRLTGLYHERYGIVLDREYFGVLTATLIPPCLAIATGILEAVLAARQGVRSVTLGYAEQGHRAQDVAAIRAMAALARETLANLGFADVAVHTVFHQYMAAFPPQLPRAEELIYQSAVTGGLSGATRLLIKTPVEALRIPSLEDNVGALQLVRRGVEAARGMDPEAALDGAALAAEEELIRREVRSILEAVIYAGGGSVARGIVEGFRRGLLDVPFSPSIYCRGAVRAARDREGAVRFLDPGELPLDRETRQLHAHLMGERRRAEGLSPRQDYLLVERDVLRVPRGQYTAWPLHSGTPAPRPAAAVV